MHSKIEGRFPTKPMFFQPIVTNHFNSVLLLIEKIYKMHMYAIVLMIVKALA